MFEARDLVSGYEKFQVLKGVSLTVPDGEIVALLGHNGAGKSTLLKAMFGLLPCWSGQLLYQGQPHTPRNSAQNARLGLRYVPQERNTFPGLPVDVNLRLGMHGTPANPALLQQRMTEIYELFPVLYERRASLAQVLSGGERQMLAISLALMTAPKLLLLDEPSLGLAPVAVQRLFDALGKMQKERGLSILLVEQNMNEALRLARTVYVMQEGSIVFNGPASEREDIIRHLWGLSRQAAPKAA